MRWVRRLPARAPVTLTMIVYIPQLDGYWSESLEVLALSLDSLRRTTPEPFELVLLDNGSCEEVRSFLHDRFVEGDIDQLILSRRNLGKVGAWNVLFATAVGDLVAYADSDVYFLPGWFEASKAVIEAFPEAAVVTAQPIPGDLSLHCQATLDGASADRTVEWVEGADLIAEELIESHRMGLGDDSESHAARLARRREVQLTRDSTRAYVSASHFQFLAPRETLARFFPLPTDVPLGDDPEFDVRVDAAGCWRLSTVEYLVHHLGNRRPNLARELPWHNPAAGSTHAAPEASPGPGVVAAAAWKKRIASSPRARRWLKALHRKSYELLYPD